MRVINYALRLFRRIVAGIIRNEYVLTIREKNRDAVYNLLKKIVDDTGPDGT
ncbi:hypothetical protein ACJ2_43430 [Pantoea sp. QMID2]|nr:hypothetical protein ACJ1_41780 [Pantoea sp. QMID1]GME48096.1 hypothetical protein ACJ3_44750 [Pantoea sp. QMID3]GME62443.1 hypothetical protein ACJ4_43320 [Pantoea sp. QMID4]GME63713.1 hypothetical protein ACJ2_43430 [Pantoea sp. QMID2]